MIRKVSNPNKSMFLCGDFNLDLLTYNNNLPTKRFIDMMFSLGMFPLISKPSRITDVSATLIDNIFTNELTYTITSGLLINDISDHLPVFAKCKYSCKNRQFNKILKLVRKLDKDSIESLKNELSLMDWENIMNETDVDTSYDMFLDVFTKMYDKHCPLKK